MGGIATFCLGLPPSAHAKRIKAVPAAVIARSAPPASLKSWLVPVSGRCWAVSGADCGADPNLHMKASQGPCNNTSGDGLGLSAPGEGENVWAGSRCVPLLTLLCQPFQSLHKSIGV